MGTTSRPKGTTSRPKGTLVTAAMVMAVIALADGCHSGSTSQASSPRASGGTGGGQPAGTSGSGTPSASGFATPGLATCQTAALTTTVDDSQADGTAGSTYYPVDFTNTTATACAMTGYPGVSFVTAADGTGRQIGTAAQRNPQYPAAAVQLPPGGHAHAWLQVAQAGNYPESSCQPVTAHGLRVYPPDQTQAGYVRQDFPACAAVTVRQLTIMPVRPGKGTQGATP